MDTVPNNNIVTAAITALATFEPETPERATDMLRSWVRRAEMTEVDLAEVQNRMFPADDLIEPPECPIWCNEEHAGEQVVPEIRECTTDDVYIPDYKGHARSVQGVQIFDRLTGRVTRPPVIRVEDLEFTPRQARVLARELESLVSMIDR